MSDHKVIGRFYFKKTDSGNLIGEFSNNHHNLRPSTESADLLVESQQDGFIGVYHTTWQEGGIPFIAELHISAKNENRLILSLQWCIRGKSAFEGEAMLCDGMLIGNYWYCK